MLQKMQEQLQRPLAEFASVCNMKEAKCMRFTGGTWTVAPQTGIVSVGDTVLAHVYGNSPEAKANARLIAVAPKLYEYLSWYLNNVDVDEDMEGDIMWLFRDINDGEVQGNELVNEAVDD